MIKRLVCVSTGGINDFHQIQVTDDNYCIEYRGHQGQLYILQLSLSLNGVYVKPSWFILTP